MANPNYENLNTLPEECEIPFESKGLLSDSLENTAVGLRTLKEKLRVKLSLGSMEAKDAQAELLEAMEGMSRRLQSYAESLQKSKQGVEVQWHLGLMEAKEQWEKTYEQAAEALRLHHLDRQQARAFLSQLNLKTHLAQAEGRDLAKSSIELLKRSQQELYQQSLQSVKRWNAHLNDVLSKLH